MLSYLRMISLVSLVATLSIVMWLVKSMRQKAVHVLWLMGLGALFLASAVVMVCTYLPLTDKVTYLSGGDDDEDLGPVEKK